MLESMFFVEIDGNRVAENMTIDIASMLVQAIFEKYYNDKKLIVTIARMDCFDDECKDT